MKSLVQVSSIKLHLVLQAIRCRGRLEKHSYSANVAQAKADNDASAPRQGIDLTGREPADPVALVSPLMMWGRSLNQIYLSHEEDIPCCLKSLHTHVSKGEVGAGRMHPIDAASRKPRKKKPEDDAGKPVPCKSLASRSWQEY